MRQTSATFRYTAYNVIGTVYATTFSREIRIEIAADSMDQAAEKLHRFLAKNMLKCESSVLNEIILHE